MPRWVPDWQALDDEGWEQFIQVGIRGTVRKSTARKYRAAALHYFDFVQSRALPFNLTSLERFLHSIRKQGAKGKTLEQYRCAVLWTQRMARTETYATDPDLVKALKGYIYQDKLNGTPRGAITEPMLNQLLDRAGAYAPAFAVIFYAVLRVGQFVRMQHGDVAISGGRCTIHLRQDKRNRAGNWYTHITTKEVVMPQAIMLLEEAQRLARPGERLFPWFDETTANDLIKQVAQDCCWPTGLQWDGVHCLRHGGCQVNKVFMARLLASLGPITGMGRRTIPHYDRLNEARRQFEELSDSDDEYDEMAEYGLTDDLIV